MERLDLNHLKNSISAGLGIVLNSSVILYYWMKVYHSLSDWIAFSIRFLETSTMLSAIPLD